MNLGAAAKTARKTLVILGVIYLVLCLFFVVKILNGETCGRIDYTAYGGGATELGVTLDAADEQFLQKVPYVNEVNYKNSRLCFAYNATDDLEINIIDGEDHVFLNTILMDGVNYECFIMEFQSRNHSHNFLGINCPDCGPGSTITFYEETLGQENIYSLLYIKGSAPNAYYDKPYNWVVSTYPTCWNSIRYFTNWYLTGGIMLMVIIGLVAGLKKSKKVLEIE